MSDLRWLTDYHAWPAKTRLWAPLAAIIAFLFFLLLGWGWFLALVIGLVVLAAVVWFTRDTTTSEPRMGSAPPAPVRPASTPAPAPRPAPQAAAPVAPPAGASMPPAAEVADSAASERVRAAAKAAGEAARLMDAPVEAVRPAGLDAPRLGVADDLKKIKGVGPKLEATLHSLGIFHFDQIAAWTENELAWVDSHLEGFNERATRDAWVEQARVLTTGGETEFSRRVDKGEVY
jgi:NADH-quinone oxidoreductase subunit E